MSFNFLYFWNRNERELKRNLLSSGISIVKHKAQSRAELPQSPTETNRVSLLQYFVVFRRRHFDARGNLFAIIFIEFRVKLFWSSCSVNQIELNFGVCALFLFLCLKNGTN